MKEFSVDTKAKLVVRGQFDADKSGAKLAREFVKEEDRIVWGTGTVVGSPAGRNVDGCRGSARMLRANRRVFLLRQQSGGGGIFFIHDACRRRGVTTAGPFRKQSGDFSYNQGNGDAADKNKEEPKEDQLADPVDFFGATLF